MKTRIPHTYVLLFSLMLMAVLKILGIPWSKWVRWLMPLLLIWLAIGCAAVLVAPAIHWSPF